MIFKNKTRSIPFLIFCLLLVLTLSACFYQAGAPRSFLAQPSLVSNIVAPTATVATATISPTATDSPTATPAAPTSTPTLLPTATFYSRPTLEPTEKASVLLAAKSCKDAHGKVDTVPFDSAGEELSEFIVYLPPCYNPNAPVRYPVLYLLHGTNNDDNQWVQIGVPAAADRLIKSGKVLPFLIVMPKEDNTEENPDDTPFDNALTEKLVPWIDQNYPTCVDRNCRAIGGLSRGSGWSLRLGLLDWQLFGAIGAHSVSPFDGDLSHLAIWINQVPSQYYPRVYLDIGSYDQAVTDAVSVERIFSLMNVPHQWHVSAGGHNKEYWMAHIKEYLLWYAQGWN